MKILSGIIVLICLFAANTALAGGGCPQSGDNLQAFAGCMAPLKGQVGTRYVGTMADMDEAHHQLVSTMQNQAVVPPHVMPSAGRIISSPYMPYYSYLPTPYLPRPVIPSSFYFSYTGFPVY